MVGVPKLFPVEWTGANTEGVKMQNSSVCEPQEASDKIQPDRSVL